MEDTFAGSQCPVTYLSDAAAATTGRHKEWSTTGTSGCGAGLDWEGSTDHTVASSSSPSLVAARSPPRSAACGRYGRRRNKGTVSVTVVFRLVFRLSSGPQMYSKEAVCLFLETQCTATAAVLKRFSRTHHPRHPRPAAATPSCGRWAGLEQHLNGTGRPGSDPGRNSVCEK